MKVLGKSLIGMNVVSDKGTVIGRLEDIAIETTSGRVVMLVVRPHRDIDVKKYEINEKGELLIPFTAVKAVRDVLIINEGGVPTKS